MQTLKNILWRNIWTFRTSRTECFGSADLCRMASVWVYTDTVSRDHLSLVLSCIKVASLRLKACLYILRWRKHAPMVFCLFFYIPVVMNIHGHNPTRTLLIFYTQHCSLSLVVVVVFLLFHSALFFFFWCCHLSPLPSAPMNTSIQNRKTFPTSSVLLAIISTSSTSLFTFCSHKSVCCVRWGVFEYFQILKLNVHAMNFFFFFLNKPSLFCWGHIKLFTYVPPHLS